MKEILQRFQAWIVPALLACMVIAGLASPASAADLSGTYSWNPVSIGAGGFVTGFCTNPSNPAVRFCRTDIGNAYRWDNINSKWMPMIVHNTDGSGMPASVAVAPAGSGCEEIAIDPGNTNVVYMSAPFYYSGDTGLASNNGTVWKSTDGGKNFTATGMSATVSPNNSWRTVSERIKVDPSNSNKVYYGSLGNGLWVTTNGGTTWSNVNAGGAPAITTNVINVAYYKNGGTVVVGGLTVSKVIYLDEAPNGTSSPAGGDVYRSTDGGQTWTNISSGAPVSGNAAKITVDQNGNIWVGSLTGANYFKYSGGVWTTITAGMNGAVAGLAVDPNNANRIFLMGGGGDMARSLDGGATWTQIQTAYSFANTLGWLPQDPTQTTYFWRSNAGLYFDSNGVLWSPEGNEGMLTFTPSAGNTESDSNPPLWSIVSQGIEEFVTHDVIIPAGSGDTAFVNVEDATGIKVTNPATFSASWVTLQGTQLISLGVGEAWCPNAPSYIAMTTMGNSNYSGYSSDNGATWHVFAAAPAIQWPGSIAVSRRGAWGLGSDHIVVLPDDNALPVYTTNGGASWATCSTFPSANGGFWAFFIYPRQLRADPFTPDKYYIYDGTHLAVSTDGGNNWSSISTGTLPTLTSNGDLETNYLIQNDLWYADGFAGGTSHGVWHSTNGGSTWTQIPFFTHAITMTLGKGDGGTGHPASAVYVYGCASDNIYGVYRSVDGGSNWDRISYYPAGIFDQPTALAASWDTYGLVYVTFQGNSAAYGKITGVTIPPAPTGLTATPGNAQVALSWTASTGATSYNVLRSTLSGSGYASVATGISTTSYTNTGLTNGTTYYFVVTATNSAGTSGNSNQASATPVAPPSAPTGLTATPGNAQVALSWTASSGATSYNVLRSTVSGSGYASVATGIATTSYTNTGLTNGTTYYFVVTATNASGTSGNSNQASATPAGGSAPSAPTGLTTSAGSTQALVFWTASTGATSYNVLRSTTSGSGYASIASGLGVTFYDNTGLTNGTLYYYVAQAVNSNGTSPNSAQASASPAAAPQAQVANATTAPVIDGTVDAIWSSATAYSINNIMNYAPGTVKSNADLSGTFQALWDTTNLYLLVTVTDDVLMKYVTNPWDGDSVEVYIDADHNGGTVYDANDFQYEFPWNSTTIVETKHSPGSLTGVVFAQANISGGYRIELKIPWTTLTVTPAANNLVGIDVHISDADTTAGTRDSKRMWNDTTDLAWNNPSLFGAAKLNAAGPPPAPTGLTATPGNAQVALSWTASTGATSYNVLRSTVSGSGYASVATGIATTSYTNTGLTNGTTYYFVVTATNAGGTSGNSNQASATPSGGSPPPAPTGLTATPGNTQVALFWTASTGATSYNVLRSTVNGSGYVSVATGITATTYYNTGLTNGTAYYFVAQAVSSGGTSPNSAQASATPAVAPQAQIAFATTAPTIDGNVDTIWSSATSYPLSNIVGTLPAGANLTATWKGLWDSTNLYLLVTVMDSTLIANTDPTLGDSAEVYIDGDHNGGTAYDANDWQYIFPWNGTTVQEWSGGHQGTNTTGITFGQVNITGGYRIEEKIPWSTIGVTAVANNLVGLDFGINDSNVSGTRACKIFWNTTADNDWINPSLFGAGKLMPGSLTPVAQINSGGAAASPFIGDTDFSGGGTFTTGATIDTSAVTNPAPVAVYQSERDGVFTYTVPGLTANAQYTVRLHFAETNFNGAGLRQFNVAINTTPVLTNFDIWATAGAENKANIQTFTATANASGQIVIAFTNGAANNPKVSGIEILH